MKAAHVRHRKSAVKGAKRHSAFYVCISLSAKDAEIASYVITINRDQWGYVDFSTNGICGRSVSHVQIDATTCLEVVFLLDQLAGQT